MEQSDQIEGGSPMYIAIVRFPALKEDKDGEFREWFEWSNRELGKCYGFMGRKLLKPVEGGNYVSIVEHESRETFAAMQESPGHAEAGRRVALLLDGNPTPEFFEVVS
jgi:heme-degrading monooxygenase HmoA